MKTLDIALLGVSVVIAAGLVSFSGVFTDENVNAYEIPNIYSSGMSMLGHAEFIVHDSDGNIKAYSQSDNAIINVGKDCAARFMFDNRTAITGTLNCKDTDLSASYSGFHFVALSNTTVISGTLDSSATLTNFADEMTGGATARSDVTPTFTAATGTTAAQVEISFASIAITDAVGSTNVTQSALLDDGTIGTDHAAAIINIPNGVSVDTGDTLTVTWTIDVG